MNAGFACYSLKKGKEAASCVPAFQVGMPKSGQATLYAESARALQSARVYIYVYIYIYIHRRENRRGRRGWSDGSGSGGGRICGEGSSVAMVTLLGGVVRRRGAGWMSESSSAASKQTAEV